MIFGVSTPKAAIELGQNILSTPSYLAASSVLKRACMLISSVLRGFSSPVAESSAAKQ